MAFGVFCFCLVLFLHQVTFQLDLHKERCCPGITLTFIETVLQGQLDPTLMGAVLHFSQALTNAPYMSLYQSHCIYILVKLHSLNSRNFQVESVRI